MFKDTIKSFFKNIKYIIIPMAFIYLGALFFIISGFKGAYNSISYFVKNTTAIVQENGENINIDLSQLQDTIKNENLANIEEVLKDTFNNIIKQIKSSSEAVSSAVTKVAEDAVGKFVVPLVLGFVFLIIMFIVGSCICGVQIRKANGLKGGLKVFVLNTLINSVFIAALVSVVAFFVQKFVWVAGVGAALLILMQALFALYRAHIVQKGGRGMFKSITFKDALKYFGMILLMYVVAVCLIGVMFALFKDAVLSVLIALPLLVYVNKFLDIYAELYVVKKSELPQNPTIVSEKK